MRGLVREIIEGSAGRLPDVEAVVDGLGGAGRLAVCLADLFEPGRDVVIARAPAVVPLFGWLSELAGTPSLRRSVSEGVVVAVQRDGERMLRVTRLPDRPGEARRRFEMPLRFLERAGGPVSTELARAYFGRHEHRAWAAGVAGVFLSLMHQSAVRFAEGIHVVVSGLPGRDTAFATEVASVVAVTRALAAEWNLGLDRRATVEVGARALDVGGAAPRRLADLVAATWSRNGEAMLTAPGGLEPVKATSWPPELELWVLEVAAPTRPHAQPSWLEQTVGTADHLLSRLAGVGLDTITPDEFQAVSEELPEVVTGSAGALPVRTLAAHAVFDHARAREFAVFLERASTAAHLEYLGELLDASHASARANHLVSARADDLVSRIRHAAPPDTIVGAGAVGHDTVVLLARADTGWTQNDLTTRIGLPRGSITRVVVGSSPGAFAFRPLRLRGA